MSLAIHGGPFRGWSARRWGVAAATAVLFTVAVAIPTDLIDTPLFWRAIPPTWWAWPALGVSAVLAGLLVATYVASPLTSGRVRSARGGYVGGFLTFFAVGCPVCNKLVLVALGTAGALTWFEPVQPFLQLIAIGLLAWALVVRLRGERACPARPGPQPAQQTRDHVPTQRQPPART